MNNISYMSITTIPPELVLHICSYLEKEWILGLDGEYDSDHEFFEYENWSYPVWCLYATGKSFSWLEELEYVCLEDTEFNSMIISRNICGVFDGFAYHGYHNLMEYSGSDDPAEGYNYSTLSFDGYHFYRSSSNMMYVEHDCERRDNNCQDPDCILCTQLNTIQKTIFEKDADVEKMFKTRKNYVNGYIVIRTKRPVLNFKFDYTGFKISEFDDLSESSDSS